MENLSAGLIGLCLIFCCALTWQSYTNTRKNIVDSGAKHVVTIGVPFTFVGIAYGLWNFDTNTAGMIENINSFLDGMKRVLYVDCRDDFRACDKIHSSGRRACGK